MQFLAVTLGRGEMLKFDADRCIVVCLNRNVPRGSLDLPSIGPPCHIYLRDSWNAGWRFLGLINSNGLVEKIARF